MANLDPDTLEIPVLFTMSITAESSQAGSAGNVGNGYAITVTHHPTASCSGTTAIISNYT